MLDKQPVKRRQSPDVVIWAFRSQQALVLFPLNYFIWVKKYKLRLQQMSIQLALTTYTLINEWNVWAQSPVVSEHPKYWKAQYFMEEWFLQCSVLLNSNYLILPFDSVANNNVLQCNWLSEKVQCVKEPRKERRGTEHRYLFFLKVIWQPDELWEFVKFKLAMPGQNCSFSVS